MANTAVGFGPPETVTVGALEVSESEVPEEEEEAEEESRMVNRGEMAYIPPCVLLMNRR